MSLIVFRHGQNRNHGDRSSLIPLPSSSFVHGSQVRIEISRIASSARNLFTGCGHLSERLCIVGDIGQNDQHVHPQIKSQILGSCQRHSRRRDTLYRRIVGQIHEHDRSVNGPRTSKVRREEIGFLIGNTDGRKDYGKITLSADNLSLTGNLGRQLCVRQSRSGKDRQLLPSYQRVQSVDSRYPGLNEFRRIVSGCRIHRKTVDIQSFFRNNFRSAIHGSSHAVEHSAQHFWRNAQLRAFTEKSNCTFLQVYTGRALEQLDQNVASVNLEDLAEPGFTAGKNDLAQFVVSYVLHISDKHQRACHF